MTIELSDVNIEPYAYNSLIYRDYRALSDADRELANELVKTVLVSVPAEFMCGASLEGLAVQRAVELNGEPLTEAQEQAVRDSYRVTVRATEEQAVGAGLVRLAAVQGRNVISVLQLQNSLLISSNGDLLIRCTVALYNAGLRIWNNSTSVSASYINVLADAQWHLLNNSLNIGNRRILVSQIDPLMKGSPYITDARLGAYITTLDAAMQGRGATLIPISLGSRRYNAYAA